MLFSLCNTLVTFQCFIHDLFRDMLDQFVVIYLNEIIFTEDLVIVINMYAES